MKGRAMVVLIDSGPLGFLTNPNQTRKANACRKWAADLKAAGHRVIIPEITDYEIRRELTLVGSVLSLGLLDALHNQFEYLPLDTRTMQLAATLWAGARQTGQPTAGDKTIDIDMILIAQARRLGVPDAVIATENLRHLQHFTTAELWSNITP